MNVTTDSYRRMHEVDIGFFREDFFCLELVVAYLLTEILDFGLRERTTVT